MESVRHGSVRLLLPGLVFLITITVVSILYLYTYIVKMTAQGEYTFQ